MEVFAVSAVSWLAFADNGQTFKIRKLCFSGADNGKFEIVPGDPSKDDASAWDDMPPMTRKFSSLDSAVEFLKELGTV